MAAIHGSKARVWFASVDVSGWLRDARLTGTVDTAEKTVLTSPAKEYAVGQSERSSSFEGLYDKDLTVVRDNLGVASGVLTFLPGGASAIGDLAWLSSVIDAQYEESAPIGDMVAFAWEATASGPVAFGYALHPWGEDTNTTTGADRDDASATATGWVAHLHVGLVDGGSWVIKLQDAATTDWTDVTGGAFTAATGVTSQRLVSAASTTALRRHVRYVATRTGGSAGNGITFGLAISRTYTP